MKRKLKLIAGPIIIIATLTAFLWYLDKNPAVIDLLKQTSAAAVTSVAILYGVVLVTLMAILYGSLQLYQKRMALQENFLLNAYSSLLNFFGPGQSGPGFRGLYLKVRHGVAIKQYVFATLLYYAFYAMFSGLLLFVASRPWWETILLLAAIAICCYAVLAFFVRRNANLISASISAATLARVAGIIGVATLVQVLAVAGVYFIELHSIDASISLSQSLAYTGAANFALFVALTPGAIGIREAFLLFSQKLHHIPSDIIVAANVLDRAIYIFFLGVLFVLVLALHAGNKLQVKKVRQEAAQAE
jgi:uncharacterized membrane protein YbhN (UPF0104 family)